MVPGGGSIEPGQNDVLILAVAVALNSMAHAGTLSLRGWPRRSWLARPAREGLATWLRRPGD